MSVEKNFLSTTGLSFFWCRRSQNHPEGAPLKAKKGTVPSGAEKIFTLNFAFLGILIKYLTSLLFLCYTPYNKGEIYMKNYYDEVMDILAKQIPDCETVYLATIDANGNPNLRPVNNEASNIDTFYLVTWKNSEKVVEIQNNPNVAVSRLNFRAWGTAENIGNPREQDPALRARISKLTAHYKERFGPDRLDDLCVVQLYLTDAVFMHKGAEYIINFDEETAEKN